MTNKGKTKRAWLYWGSSEVNLGVVTDFSETLQKQVTSTPIASRSSAYTLAIESGAKNTISIGFAHRHDEDGVSNATWQGMLTNAIDRWQVKTDGVTLRIYTYDEDGEESEDKKFDYHKGSSQHGYISSLSVTQPTSMTDILTGSLSITLGSRTVSGSGADGFQSKGVSYETPSGRISDSSVSISFDKGASWVALSGQYGDTDSDDTDTGADESIVKTYTISGGQMEPFEKIVMRVSQKQFVQMFPELYPEDGSASGPEHGRTRLRVSGIGNWEYIVTEISQTTSFITFTGQSIAIASMVQTVTGSLEPVIIKDESVDDLDSLIVWQDAEDASVFRPTPSSTLSLTYIEAIVYRLGLMLKWDTQGDTVDNRLLAESKIHVDVFSYLGQSELTLPVDGSVTVWALLQTLAQMFGARVFFAQGHLQFVDYTRAYQSTSNEDLQSDCITVIGTITAETSSSETVTGLENCLDAYDDLSDRLCGELDYASGENDICNSITVKVGEESAKSSNQTSISKWGERAYGSTWDLSEQVTSLGNGMVAGSTFLIAHATPYKQVTMTLKDVVLTTDTANTQLWKPMFPPCTALMGLKVPQDSVQIKVEELH